MRKYNDDLESIKIKLKENHKKLQKKARAFEKMLREHAKRNPEHTRIVAKTIRVITSLLSVVLNGYSVAKIGGVVGEVINHYEMKEYLNKLRRIVGITKSIELQFPWGPIARNFFKSILGICANSINLFILLESADIENRANEALKVK